MKDQQINNIFSSFLIERKLDFDHHAVAHKCYQFLMTSDDYNQKNIFHNPDIMVEFKDLFVEIDKIANETHKLLQYKQDTKQVCIDAWINQQGSLNTAVPHQHPTADIAIVYYPQAEKGCDTLELLNPNSKLQYVMHEEMVEQWNNYNSYTWNIIPKTGKVVIFPGYLMHYVKQSDWNKKRVSIAFNYKVAW